MLSCFTLLNGSPKQIWFIQETIREGNPHKKRFCFKGVFETTLRTLLHKLHHRAAPKKTGLCEVSL